MKEALTAPRVITVDWLCDRLDWRRDLEGCAEKQIDRFRRTFGASADLTRANLARAAEVGLNLDWFAEVVLQKRARQKFKREMKPAWKDYERATEAAGQNFERATEPPWQNYKRAREAADQNYERVRATEATRLESERGIEPALLEYWRARCAARQVLERVRAPARQKYERFRAEILADLLGLE